MFFFFFNDTATTEIYTLSLHDALPIYFAGARGWLRGRPAGVEYEQGEPSGHGPHLGRGRQRALGLEGSPCSDRKSTRLNSSHANISYAVFCLKKKNNSKRARCSLLASR